jgi:hypothetical protein
VSTLTADPGPRSLRGSDRGRRADPIFRGVLMVAASSVLLILAAMIIRTTIEAWPVFAKEGILGFLTGEQWSVGTSRSEVTGTYGAWPFIYGTLKISFIAIVFAVPTAIGIALFTNEVAPAWLKKPLASTVDTLAMIPSIVYALVGMYFFRIEFWAPAGRVVADSPLGNLTLLRAAGAARQLLVRGQHPDHHDPADHHRDLPRRLRAGPRRRPQRRLRDGGDPVGGDAQGHRPPELLRHRRRLHARARPRAR